MDEMLKTLGEKICVCEMSKLSGQSNMLKPRPIDEKEWFKKPRTGNNNSKCFDNTKRRSVCILLRESCS